MVCTKKTYDGYIVIDENTGKLLSENCYKVFKISKYAYAGIRNDCQEKIVDIYNRDYGRVLTILTPEGYELNFPEIDIKEELAIGVELTNVNDGCAKKLFYTNYGEDLNEYLIACNLNPNTLRIIGCSVNNNEIEFADRQKCYVFSLDDYCIMGTRELDAEKEF